MIARFGPAEMERSLKWSEAFGGGHEELDREHHRLVALINDLYTSVTIRDAMEVARRLRALVAESKRHLEHETLVLRELRRDLESPANEHVPRQLKTSIAAAIEDHIAEHSALRRRLADVTRTVRNGRWVEGGTSPGELIGTWFLDHAVKYDSQIKTILQAMQVPPSRT
jgi:hemerythrin